VRARGPGSALVDEGASFMDLAGFLGDPFAVETFVAVQKEIGVVEASCCWAGRWVDRHRGRACWADRNCLAADHGENKEIEQNNEGGFSRGEFHLDGCFSILCCLSVGYWYWYSYSYSYSY